MSFKPIEDYQANDEQTALSIRESSLVGRFEPPHDKTNRMTVRPAKTHPPKLIKVFAVRSVGS